MCGINKNDTINFYVVGETNSNTFLWFINYSSSNNADILYTVANKFSSNNSTACYIHCFTTWNIECFFYRIFWIMNTRCKINYIGVVAIGTIFFDSICKHMQIVQLIIIELNGNFLWLV